MACSLGTNRGGGSLGTDLEGLFLLGELPSAASAAVECRYQRTGSSLPLGDAGKVGEPSRGAETL